MLFIFMLLHENVNSEKTESKLIKHLLNGYDMNSRPVENVGEAVNVTIGLAAYQLIEINEKLQYIKLSAWVYQQWKDSSLIWNPQDYNNIEDVNLSPEYFWKPDIVLINNLNEDVASYGGSLDTQRTRMIIHHDGKIKWNGPIILKVRCQIDVKHFPFDTQTCSFLFGSWTYRLDKLNIFGENIRVDNYTRNQEWNLLDYNMVRKESNYSQGRYPDVMFQFRFQRRTLFYVVNLILPIILITLLTIIGNLNAYFKFIIGFLIQAIIYF